PDCQAQRAQRQRLQRGAADARTGVRLAAVPDPHAVRVLRPDAPRVGAHSPRPRYGRITAEGESMSEWVGWTATAVFTASYFFKSANSLRRVQIAGAVLWVVYGFASHARPVVAANVLVLAAAALTTWRQSTPVAGNTPGQT